ncbi:MAG: hypothetical protein LBU89_10105 [Fibromonadaceae bacterium]|jgi:hypothetical protein|nr:hypothetical protein [Fibromonadaceae bacterium]
MKLEHKKLGYGGYSPLAIHQRNVQREGCWGIGYRLVLKILIIGAIGVQTISCASFKATAPNDFAAYDKGIFDTKFKAISSDGVLYRVSEYKQESKASTDFWKEAFLLKMSNSNYKQEEELNISISGKPAIAYVFSFATNTGSDLYLVTAIPVKNKMVVVEATAENEKFNNRRSDILEAINKLKL